MPSTPPLMPPTITYDAVPGSDGLWTASIDTSAGRITATRHSLLETREALEVQVRMLTRTAGHALARDDG